MPNDYSQNAVYLQSGSPETENRPIGGGYDGQIGSRFTVKDPPASVGGAQVARTYQLVTVDSAMDVAPSSGAVAWWRRSSGYVVTTDVSVAGRGNVAGVFRTAVAVTNVGCIQLDGPVDDLQIQSGTPLDTGLQLIPSSTDAKADVMTAGTAATYPTLGVTTSAGAGGVCSALLDLPGRP